MSFAPACPTNSAPRSAPVRPMRKSRPPRLPPPGPAFISAFTAAMAGARTISPPRFTTAPPSHLPGRNLRAAVYGGHAGYNWQFDRAVAGFELGSQRRRNRRRSPSPALRCRRRRSRQPTPRSKPSVRSAGGWDGCRSTMSCSTGPPVSAGSVSTRSPAFASTAPAGSLTSSTYIATDRFGWVAGVGVETITARRQLDRASRISALRLWDDCSLRRDYQCRRHISIPGRRPWCRCRARRRVLQIRRIRRQ